jgi:hypothetical protein
MVAEMVPMARLPHGQILPGGPVTAKLLSMIREAMYGKRLIICLLMVDGEYVSFAV